MQNPTEKQVKRYRVIARNDGFYFAYRREAPNNMEIYWTERVEEAEHFETVSRLLTDAKKLRNKKKKVTHYLLRALPESRAVSMLVEEELIANRKIQPTSSFEDVADLEQEIQEEPV